MTHPLRILILLLALLALAACGQESDPIPAPPTEAPPVATEPAVAAAATPSTGSGEAETAVPAQPDEVEGDPDAALSNENLERLIAEAGQRAADLPSLKFTQNIRTDFSGVSQFIRQNCQVKRGEPASLYCVSETTTDFAVGEVEPDVHTNEIVQIGNSLWMRQGEDGWQQYTDSEIETLGFSSDNLQQQQHLSQFITDPQVASRAMIDGVEVVEIAFTIDVPAYYSFLVGEEQAAELMGAVQQANGTGSLWIGQLDRLPRRLVLIINVRTADEEVITTTEGNYFDFNDPVEIPDPEGQ